MSGETNERTPADVLRAAAERVRTRGHHRGTYVDNATGAVCALGAVYDLKPNVQPSGLFRDQIDQLAPVQHEAAEVLSRFICLPVPTWNDRIVRDGEEAAATMEKAAAAWEENPDA